ncbi:MAG: diphosphomevalonate decarboxylase, partial [Anaerolineales bacterium]
MDSRLVTALAHPNLALIKYWGNRDDRLRIPANGSIALTLGAFETRTEAEWIRGLGQDELTVNGRRASAASVSRTSSVLDALRDLGGFEDRARIASTNSFPTGAGLASSSSAFAALTVAAAAAAGLDLDEPT